MGYHTGSETCTALALARPKQVRRLVLVSAPVFTDPARQRKTDKGDPAKLAAKEAEYRARFANPFVAGARGYIDDVIQPHETRKRVCRSLMMLREKKIENPWRKHGNIPL